MSGPSRDMQAIWPPGTVDGRGKHRSVNPPNPMSQTEEVRGFVLLKASVRNDPRRSTSGGKRLAAARPSDSPTTGTVFGIGCVSRRLSTIEVLREHEAGVSEFSHMLLALWPRSPTPDAQRERKGLGTVLRRGPAYNRRQQGRRYRRKSCRKPMSSTSRQKEKQHAEKL